MDQTTHTVPAGFVWPTVGHPGQVPLWAIVPNENQPRKEAGFDDEELDSLADTMRPENGGELREIITVRELYEHERKDYPPHVRYKLISGERRWRSAQRVGLVDVEIRVKRYKSHVEEEDDMYMLNEKRVGLSDIENAEYLARIMRNHNFDTQEQLATHVGKYQTEISMFLSLLKLSPRARAAMSPKIPEFRRMKRQVGVYLSHLEHSVQDDFVERMPQERTTVTQQIAWMQEELKEKAIELPAKRESPGVMRQIMGYFADSLKRRSLEILGKKNIDRLFENTKPGQTQEVLRQLVGAQHELNRLVEKVRGLAGVEEGPANTAPAPKPAVQVPAPKAPVTQEARAGAARFLERRAETAQTPALARRVQTSEPGPAPRPAPVLNGKGKEKTVSYLGPTGRTVTDKVSQEKYLELWDKGELKFQIEKKERPAWMPTREAAVEDWNKYCD